MRNTRNSRGTRKESSSRIGRDKKADQTLLTPDVAVNSGGPTSSLNGMTSLEPNQAAHPSGNCSKSFICVHSDEGLNLSVDLDATQSELAQDYSLFHAGSNGDSLVPSKIKIRDIPEEAQLKASLKNGDMKEMAKKEDICCGDESAFSRGAQLETPIAIENEKPTEVAVQKDIDCGDKLPLRGGSQQLTPSIDEHEAPTGVEPPEEVAMEEYEGCDDKLLDSRQVATDFGVTGLTPSSLASDGMSGGGRGGKEAVVEEEEVVHVEDALKLLAEHLVRPGLPRRTSQHPRHMTPEKQQAVAQQVHTAIILYNYYHRKGCTKLIFADPERFFACASLSVGEDLLPYLSMVHGGENNSGNNVSLSVTDRAAVQACEIAAELNAFQDYPDMGMWPIAKVAVLLLDPTKKKCLAQYSAETLGVWSFIEKEYDAAAAGVLDGPLILQELAMSEVQRRTGLERSDLLVIDETLTYSLSKARTTTKLFIVEYKKTTKGKLVETSLEELISSMTGPVLVNDPFPKTTSVVDHYHILPYKKILEELLGRKWTAVPRHEMQIDEKLEEQDENSTSKMQKQIRKVSTPNQNKREIIATGANSNQNSSISKHKKSSKRKAEASMDIAADGPDGKSPIIENESLNVDDMETSNLMTKASVRAGPIVLQSGEQVDKNKTGKQSVCDNVVQYVFPMKARYVDPAIKNGALERQNVEVAEKSGGVTENNNDQMYELLLSIQKIRDENLHKECILHDRSIQCEMDMQTILNEGKMTPKVLSIEDKYKGTCSNVVEVTNSSCSGDGGQTMGIERMKLKEALLVPDKCQELHEICNKCKWILPRYTIIPSAADGMFRASVHLTGPDFDMRIAGDPSPTPHEARFSAASNMIVELYKKAKEE